MAGQGNKQQSGAPSARTVLQLQPVHYKVTLSYLGHERIIRNTTDYRCRYTVEPDATPGSAAFHERDPRILPNVVRGTDTDTAAVNAATPYAQNGTSENPPAAQDQVYRVMIQDNHGVRRADTLPANNWGLIARTGTPDGDTVSKPANYNTNGWMPDVSPAIPLRVVVRKFIGTAQQDLTRRFKVVVQVKDPVEELAPGDTARSRPRRFLNDFFNRYNRTSSDPDAGDDNAPTLFQGKRQHPASGSPAASVPPGVRATDVLKTIPYRSPPVADQPPAGTSPTINFADLTAATAHGTADAEFTLSQAQEQVGQARKRIGVADMAFCPWPAGGDNYRFLITLIDDSGQDVRLSQENGRAVELIDETGAVIPSPRAYTSGRFVIWKRLNIKLVVLVNGVASSTIDWNSIRGMYRKSFIEVTPPADPAGYHALTAQAWLTELQDPAIFPDAADRTALAGIATAAPPNDLAAVYQHNFFPAAVVNARNTDAVLYDKVEPLARNIINHTCAALTPPLQSPNDGPGLAQTDPDGYYLVLIRQLTPTSSNVGASFGDRQFWFASLRTIPGTTTTVDAAAYTTHTCQHEMGHAMYLRHGHVLIRPAVYWASGSRRPQNIQLIDGSPMPVNSFNALMDHDQSDAYNCLMSYTRPLQNAEACGMCRLTLRFYDRVAIQQQVNFRDRILSGASPIRIVRARPLGGGGMELDEDVPSTLVAGEQLFLVVVGPQVMFTDHSGPPAQPGRLNLTAADPQPIPNLWSATSGGSPSDGIALSMSGKVLRLDHRRRGEYVIRYRNGSLTAQVTVNAM